MLQNQIFLDKFFKISNYFTAQAKFEDWLYGSMCWFGMFLNVYIYMEKARKYSNDQISPPSNTVLHVCNFFYKITYAFIFLNDLILLYFMYPIPCTCMI